MHRIILFSLIFLSAGSLFAQDMPFNLIKIEDNKYYYRNKLQTEDQLSILLKKYPSSKDLLDLSRFKKYAGYALLATGIAIHIYWFPDYIESSDSYNKDHTNEKINTYMIVGAGCELLGLISLISSSSNFKEAIEKYNEQVIYHSSSGIEVKYNLGFSGAGITVRF